MTEVLNAAFYGLGAFLSAFAALAIMSGRGKTRDLSGSADLSGDTLVFLIRNGEIDDMNFPARRYLDALPGSASDLDRLRSAFASRTDASEDLLTTDPGCGDIKASSQDGTAQFLRDVTGDAIRIKVIPQNAPTASGEDIHRLSAMEAELELLRANTHVAPFLAWRQNAKGIITWVNQSYLNSVDRRFGPKRKLDWPLPGIFGALDTKRTENASGTRRIAIEDDDGKPLSWFDCSATPVGGETYFVAVNADETVRAEQQLRDFTQTLTKTFADLTVGLVVFDRARQLALFNPALASLSNLSVDFLSSRPSLEAFLDALREQRMMPEPRDYRTWRASITDLEDAAKDGLYCETWSLPGNQTYRVTGRPHPDGAIAFLFEDISEEMALTRRFRAELELQHALIDSLDEAVAVFSASGTLIVSNDAYNDLWDTEEPGLGTEIGVVDATRSWHEKTLPTPIWGDFREFAQSTDDRGEWTARVHMRDGRDVACKFAPAPSGATLAIFRAASRETRQHDDFREAV